MLDHLKTGAQMSDADAGRSPGAPRLLAMKADRVSTEVVQAPLVRDTERRVSRRCRVRRRQSGNLLCTTLVVTLSTFIRGPGGYRGRSGEVACLGSASTLTILDVYLLSSCRVVRERPA